MLVTTDARQHAVFSRVDRQATSGAGLELTIDQFLQHIAERELRAGVDETRAAGGTAVVMDPAHRRDPGAGQLADASIPTRSRSRRTVARRNRAVQDLYEPGSTFKLVTASAALEEHVVVRAGPDRLCAGLHQVRRTAADPRRAPLRRAAVLGRHRQVEQRRRDQGRAEARPRTSRALRQPLRVRPADRARLPRREPRHRLESRAARRERARVGLDGLPGRRDADADGGGSELDRQRRDADRAARRPRDRSRTAADRWCSHSVLRRTVSARTAAELTAIMEEVVERGTAKTAQIPGFTIAGKTGTAAKLVNGRYSKSDYNASFVGFVPSRESGVDDHRRHRLAARHSSTYGGVIAAPVFKRIAEASLRQIGVRAEHQRRAPGLVAPWRRAGRLPMGPRPILGGPETPVRENAPSREPCRICADLARAKRCGC